MLNGVITVAKTSFHREYTTSLFCVAKKNKMQIKRYPSLVFCLNYQTLVPKTLFRGGIIHSVVLIKHEISIFKKVDAPLTIIFFTKRKYTFMRSSVFCVLVLFSLLVVGNQLCVWVLLRICRFLVMFCGIGCPIYICYHDIIVHCL